MHHLLSAWLAWSSSHLFVGHELQVDVYAKIGGLFIAAMLALITALGCYLREITLATSVIENLKRTALRFDGRL